MLITREDVLAAGKKSPNSELGDILPGTVLIEPTELSKEVQVHIPDEWDGLQRARSTKELVDAIVALWEEHSPAGAIAPKILKERIRYAAFTPRIDDVPYIFYVLENSDTEGVCLSFAQGSPPLKTESLTGWPDYGDLTSFCTNIHGDFGGLYEHLRHPSWRIVRGRYKQARKMPTWGEWYTDALPDYWPDSIEFHEGFNKRRDDEAFRPDPILTRKYSETNSDNFVEPGDPVRFWRFWNKTGHLELDTPELIYPFANSVDQTLGLIMGNLPHNLL